MVVPMLPGILDASIPVSAITADDTRSVGRRAADWIEDNAGVKLAPFQRRFLSGALRRGVHSAALSGPRGLSKSSLTGWLLGAALDPSGPLFVPGGESILLAGSIDQARAVFAFLRQVAPPGRRFRYIDTAQRMGVTHVDTRTRVRVIGSNAKRAFGLVNSPLVIGDEPASWEARGGRLMFDALSTTGGKSAMRLILIGTRAPAESPHWWLDLLHAGSTDGTYVQCHGAEQLADGSVPGWDTWRVIKRAHPLVGHNPHLRPKIKAELAAARKSDDARARFLSYRLNVPTRPPAEVLFTASQWREVEAREPGPMDGQPIVGVDMGANRSWSAAAVLWPSKRVEVVSVAPGIPDITEQERRDGVPRGAYLSLVESGSLILDQGRRVVRVDRLMDAVMNYRPCLVVADRFRLQEVVDAVGGRCRVQGRVTRWQESTDDITRARQVAVDEGLSIGPVSAEAVRFALSQAVVEQDTSGNVRVGKLGANRRSRQDIVMALVLALGRVPRVESGGAGYAVA